MKSKTSFFNTGVAKNLLRRCWPLWACYFAALIFLLPVLLLNMDPQGKYYFYQMSENILNGGRICAIYLSFVTAVLAAMCMFGFMYNTRSCGMMTSLPVKRETMFCTAYLCGLLPMFAADVLTVALTWLLTIGNSAVQLTDLLQWLAMVMMGNVVFYGFAVFCAMLTGSLIILPAVYAVLSLAAVVAEFAAATLMEDVVYGYEPSGLALVWLSPVAALIDRFTEVSAYMYIDDLHGLVEPHIVGWGVLIAYFAVGLALSALALLLYRRRKMEVATDTVAFPVLKPMFRWCMAFGTGLVFALLMYNGFFSLWFGPRAAVAVGVLLVIGAVIGWFAAEMLIQKTVKVFRGKWAGCIAVCCIFAALTVCLETDVFGLEQRMPDASEIEEVRVYNSSLEQPENIEKAIELNKAIVSHKKANEADGNHMTVEIRYRFKDGSYLDRPYTVDRSDAAVNDPESDIRKAQELVNVKEAVNKRFFRSNGDPSSPEYEMLPIREEYLEYVMLYNSYTGESYKLPEDVAMDFITGCVLPDVEDMTLGRGWLIDSGESLELNTRWELEISLQKTEPGTDGKDRTSTYLSAMVQTDARRTMAWIKENTELDVRPMKDYVEEEQGEPAATSEALYAAPIDRPVQ